MTEFHKRWIRVTLFWYCLYLFLAFCAFKFLHVSIYGAYLLFVPIVEEKIKIISFEEAKWGWRESIISATMFALLEQLFRIVFGLSNLLVGKGFEITAIDRLQPILFHIVNAILAIFIYRKLGKRAALIACTSVHIVYNLAVILVNDDVRRVISEGLPA